MSSEEIDKKCIEVIYELHITNKDEKYIQFTNNIISDVLMGKIKNGKLRGINDFVKNTIIYFYEFANKLSNTYILRGCEYTVYRGIFSPNIIVDNNKIIQPIPFSASIYIHNADNWIGVDCCRLHIYFDSETPFICIDNEIEGKEVILPAGVLNIVEQWEENGIKNYKCILDSTKTYEEMIELQKKYKYI
jgi:hypothetical protein